MWMQLLQFVLLVVGFVLLIVGADRFVDGAVLVSKKLRIPAVIIGLTVVAFGTSLPEAAVSISAALSGSNDIALGNVIGSNLFNLLMVGGLSAAIRPMVIDRNIMRTDLPYSILCSVAMLLLALGTDAMFSQYDGLILLLFFLIFMVYTVRGALSARGEDAVRTAAPQSEATQQISPLRCTLLIVIGIVCIVAGGQLVVSSATSIARFWGVSEALIGLTIVAFGTSLPELVTSVMAARKGANDIAMGNIIGSNLFNILFVLGASASLHAVPVGSNTVIDTALLIGASLLVYFAALRNKRLSRPVGISMVALYFVYMAYIMVR